jgi:stage V sporulation protein SpoVS
METVELQVSRTTNVKKAADAIFTNVNQAHSVTIITVGEKALNQMTKALCIARGELATRGKNLAWFSGFKTITGRNDGESISAIKTTLFLMKA